MAIPYHAFFERPYVAPNLIRRAVSHGGEVFDFTIDPGTQNWALLDQRARFYARLADGRTRLADIMGTASTDICTADLLTLHEDMRSTGLSWSSMREQRQASTPVYAHGEPVGLHLEITNACNLSCKHCYVASGKPLPNEMSDAEIYRAIDLLPPFAGLQLAISGGEPIARKNCMDFVRYAAMDCGHRVDLYTNAWKFPRKYAETIKSINDSAIGHVRIQMSLEGANGQTNDMVRGVGSYSEAMKSLQMFKEMGLARDVVLFVCITASNIHEIDALIELAETHGIGQLVFSQWQRQGHAQDTPWAKIAPTTEEWVAAGERILRYSNPNMRVYGNFHGDIRNTPEGRLDLDSPLFPKHIFFFNAFPRITPEGDILADQLWVSEDWFLGKSEKRNHVGEGVSEPEISCPTGDDARAHEIHRRLQEVPLA
ncbi:MoaA/NifB/PqqE/SkfB family radical SAM enzyme [Roseibium hamelinense]|uniref:MoaA/NifB/PqqE/SkfB family radical SAM enzyme n=1 Tax=Roseibium hamelinense TaxID=150831 RepID=A0A562T950_9HYPH|nr:radical SAM protein [Roseibium hamelinense]MTI45571.1 radical SAM protein [Roseibium hamelinense]TWI90052.1 MoaA/NifB/PqqE/SkfB family radical SAM enzyme [Roseibium hamelinense]